MAPDSMSLKMDGVLPDGYGYVQDIFWECDEDVDNATEDAQGFFWKISDDGVDSAGLKLVDGSLLLGLPRSRGSESQRRGCRLYSQSYCRSGGGHIRCY